MLHITISDDGRGIDPERLRAKVLERKLATPAMAGQLSEAERRGSGEGREQTGDQFVLGETMRHSRPANSQLLAISPGRNSRARRSSTALIMPDSTGPKKAPATSTYSLMTTRIGTSLRLRSS